MPVYEYYCESCARRFEALRTISLADTPIACPRCETPGAKRVISTFAAISRDGSSSRMVTGGSSGCGSCSGGHCATCGH